MHLARENGFTAEISNGQSLESGRALGNLIRVAFQHKKLTTEFPTVSIPAALHAAIRLEGISKLLCDVD